MVCIASEYEFRWHSRGLDQVQIQTGYYKRRIEDSGLLAELLVCPGPEPAWGLQVSNLPLRFLVRAVGGPRYRNSMGYCRSRTEVPWQSCGWAQEQKQHGYCRSTNEDWGSLEEQWVGPDTETAWEIQA